MLSVELVVVGSVLMLSCALTALFALSCVWEFVHPCGTSGGGENGLAATGLQTEKPKNPNSVYRKRERGAEVAARGHHNGVLDLSV